MTKEVEEALLKALELGYDLGSQDTLELLEEYFNDEG